MKIQVIYILIIFLNLLGCDSYTQSLNISSVNDFKPIDKLIHSSLEKFKKSEILIVLDIDNTILTADTDLGSDIWYQWQNDELDIKPSPEQKLTKDCLYNEAIGLLYELGTMSLTDTLLPTYLNQWQQNNLAIMALTSRSPDYRAATERELQRNGIDLSVSEPRSIEGNKISFDYSLKRKISYRNGIFMTTGLNKGEMLSHFIARTGNSYKCIIFIDDSEKNVEAVKTTYSTCKNTEVIIFHYTKIVEERLKSNNHQIITREQAQKMADDWEELIQLLNKIFPERMNKSDCSL